MKDIKELLISDFKNVYVINDNHAKDMNLTEDLLKNAIVVYVRDGFESTKRRIQWFENEKYVNNLYFIGKTNTVLERYDFIKYLTKNPDKTFVLINDSDYGWNHKPLMYMTSEPNKLILRAYDIDNDYRIKPIFTLENINGKTIWKNPKIYDKSWIESVDPTSTNYDRGIRYIGIYGDRRNDGHIERRSGDDVYLYNPEQKGFITIDLNKIMNTYINIVGENRITAKYHGDGVSFDITADEFSVGNVNCKYGVQSDKIDDYYSYSTPSYDMSDVYPKSELDEETYKRVTEYIETCLKTNIKTKGAPGTRYRYSNSTAEAGVTCKDLVVISAPAPKHQCPTFHYFIGLKSKVCDKIDIVELVRGELYIKTMIPKTCYVLDKSGIYCRVKNKMFSGMKDLVGEGEIDSVTLQEWSEDKALHPELIDAVIKSGKMDIIGLPTLKIFNNVPFGALFIEQLVKDDKLVLAKQLGEYIYEHADKLEFTCNSLVDIFPDANPEGGSLLKAFNLTKPCYDLLFELVGDMTSNQHYDNDYCDGKWFKTGKALKRCIEMYKLIKAYIPTGVVTSENRKLLSQYIYLKDNDSVHFRDYRTRSEFDLLDHPKLIKPIYKMVNKITTSFNGSGNEWEARRHYDEILTAYIKFLMLGWNPEDYKIFIEFGLSGSWSEMLKELTEREAAANKALKIYEDKINEAAHKKNEDQYKIRKESIEKLAAKQIIVKDSAGQNHLYSIIVPSQIYGEDTIGSIEKEGKDMKHCLFRQYADQISNGTYTVVYLRDKHDPDTSLVTIGINRDGRINQTYGVNDNWITEQQAQAIAQWAKSKEGLVTFRAEKSIVSPGGWNNCVGVPTLKEVDQNWLRKLAQIA